MDGPILFYGVIVIFCVFGILGLLFWSLTPERVVKDDRDETDEAGA